MKERSRQAHRTSPRAVEASVPATKPPMPTEGTPTRQAVKASCTPSHTREIQATVPWRPTPLREAPRMAW